MALAKAFQESLAKKGESGSVGGSMKLSLLEMNKFCQVLA